MAKRKVKNICPRCMNEYDGFPALSRRDNKTDICSGCGTEEAFIDYSLPAQPPPIRREILFMTKLIRNKK